MPKLRVEFALVGDTATVEYVIERPKDAVSLECVVFIGPDGKPALGELCIRLLDPDFTGYGISSQILRDLTLHQLLQPAREALARLEADPEWESEARLWWKFLREQPASGRRRLPPEFYVSIAREYVRAVSGGSRRPVADVAEAFSMSPSRVRDILHEARRRGLLTRPGQGRAGGELTDDAKTMLRLLASQQRAKRVQRER